MTKCSEQAVLAFIQRQLSCWARLPRARRDLSIRAVSVLLIGHVFLVLPPCTHAVTREWSPETHTEVELREFSIALGSLQEWQRVPPPAMSRPNSKERDRLMRYISHQCYGDQAVLSSLTDDMLSHLDPAETLVYLLGGLPRAPAGQRVGSAQPLSTTMPRRLASATPGVKVLFEFDPTRLRDRDGDGFWEYLPPDSDAPYVYFDFSSYGQEYTDPSHPEFGVAVAYRKTANEWYFPESYQVISAGRDNCFGSGDVRVCSGWDGFTSADYDNTASFADHNFAEIVLQNGLQQRRGTFLKIVVYLFAIGIPLCLWMAIKSRGRFSLKALILLSVAVAATIGLAAADVRCLGAGYALKWLQRDSGGSALAILWLGLVFVLCMTLANRRLERSRFAPWWLLLMTVVPFLSVPYPETSSWRGRMLDIAMCSGWPLTHSGENFLGTRMVAFSIDALVGLGVGVLFWLVARRAAQGGRDSLDSVGQPSTAY